MFLGAIIGQISILFYNPNSNVNLGQRPEGGDTHLWTVTVVKRGLQEALGGRFVFSRGQLCQTCEHSGFSTLEEGSLTAMLA